MRGDTEGCATDEVEGAFGDDATEAMGIGHGGEFTSICRGHAGHRRFYAASMLDGSLGVHELMRTRDTSGNVHDWRQAVSTRVFGFGAVILIAFGSLLGCSNKIEQKECDKLRSDGFDLINAAQHCNVDAECVAEQVAWLCPSGKREDDGGLCRPHGRTNTQSSVNAPSRR